jgi:asparagine synthase (glutamine-hydrolysing)
MGTDGVAAPGRPAAGSFDLRGGPPEPHAPGSEPLCLFDGRLDEVEALRAELGEPRGAGPEALLIAGFRRWGAGLPERLRGDFAFALWDPERGEALLARDQLGVRPLFLARAGGRLHFAFELRDLLERLPTAPAPDPAGVAHWVSLSTRPGNGTLYAGVERLGPGELLSLGRDGGSRRLYWQPRFREPLDLPESELAGLVREELRDAVRRRRDPERETGVLLSGGLDSASIAAVADDGLRACSGVFPEHPETDEAELIGELRRSLRLRGPVAEVRPGGLLASVLEHVDAWRVPLIGWGDFWTLPLLRAAAREGVGTILGGDGGDELFGPRVYALADELRAGRPRRVLELARRLPGAPYVGRREQARMIARLALGGGAPPRPAGSRLQGTGDAPAWITPTTRRALRRSDDPDAWKRLDGPRWWAHAAYTVSSAIEATGVFEHQRRRAASVGLQARHPILDLDLVELCLRQPPERTLDPRFTRPVLRAATAGLLPDAVRLRPQKALFEAVVVSCLTGPDAAAVRQILLAPDAEIGAYVDRERMEAALFGPESVLRGDPFGWMWQVWRLLNAEVWLRSLGAENGFPERFSAPSATSVTVRSGSASYLFPP